VRRFIGLVLAVGLMAASTGAVAAGNPNRAASLWACMGAQGLHLQVDWTAYHPDTLTTVATSGGTSSAYPTDRQVDWKFGTSSWDTSLTTWATVNVDVSAGTSIVVDLYGKGKFLGETNAVDTTVLPSC